ncbi:MAG: hypothetical protein DMG72_13900 [Acidobacteria bacterium]|nr:MAG: hypothetical protein DMG72_13900 [Acidobacteriota bacterium]
MKRIYEYRRHLPHYQSDNKGIFVTFCTHHRWVLPAEARMIVLNACVWGDAKRFALHGAIVMPDHVHLVLTPLYDGDGFYCIAEITQGIKSSSAHKINRLLDRKGQVWHANRSIARCGVKRRFKRKWITSSKIQFAQGW